MRALLTRAVAVTFLAAGFGMAFTASSCTTPATEIVPGFTTQIRVPDELRSVVVVITQGGRPIRCRVYPVHDASVTLPATIGIIPAEDRDGVPPEPVITTVLGFSTVLSKEFENECFLGLPDADDARVMVVRRAALQYTEDRILFVPMPLRESCLDKDCPDDQTCIGGVCEDATIDGSLLAEYRDDLIFGDSNTCFDPEICMKGAALAVMTDKESCTYTLPVPEDLQSITPRNPGQLNVELVYTSGGTEILDVDEREGFVFPDDSDPWTFRLASNLCASQFPNAGNQLTAPHIVGVYASPLCTAKRALQPICTDALSDIQEGGRAPLSFKEQNGICPIGPPLQATESALYVLMDRSASMAEFFGDEGLEFAVGIPLENPVAARTRLAFSFLPADMDDCPDGLAFQTPTFGFAEPNTLRVDIGSALADAGTLLGNDPAADPMVYMDAALRGAYAALHGIPDPLSATFNRKAVVLIGNRDFESRCATNNALEALAAVELADPLDPIHTYVAVLNAPPTANNHGAPPPQTAGAIIATAGGTEVFDAVANETEGALAVQKVLNDLGSCLYDPLNIELPGMLAEEDEVRFLSFVNPVTQEGTMIQRDLACDSPDVNVDGFGYDPRGQVVICGQPCQRLRQTLTDTATYFALQQQPAPAIPIRPSLTCARKAEILRDLAAESQAQ